MKRAYVWMIVLVLGLGAARFVYSIVAAPYGLTDETHMNLVYETHEIALIQPTLRPYRWWGPLFPMAFRTLRTFDFPQWLFNLVQRLALLALYVGFILFLVRGLDPAPLRGAGLRTTVCRAALVFLMLQSSAAIYAISGGMGEVLAAFCVVAHHWFFARKRYLFAAALLLCVGVYFKLWPLVFVWPYALFALLSRSHRIYIGALALSAVVLAAVSLPIMGWWYGALYPLAMVYNILTIGTQVPVGSAEVIGLVFVAERIGTGFSLAAEPWKDLDFVRTLGGAATLLLFAGTTCAAIVLARTERRWSANPADRLTALLLFDAVVGFCALSFSLDLSLAHLLYVTVSLYAPLLLWAEPAPEATWDYRPGPLTVGLFTIGIVLVGSLLPLSIVFRIVPPSVFDALSGNDVLLPRFPWHQVPLARYMWYQLPLVGAYLIAAALVVTWATARRRAVGSAAAATFATSP